MLMDRRHTKECIAERIIAEPHSELKYVDISCRDVTQGIFIGGSCMSRQMYVHNIELAGRDSPKGDMERHTAAGGLSGLLSAASFSGMKVTLTAHMATQNKNMSYSICDERFGLYCTITRMNCTITRMKCTF